jgi:hypothetical protein
MFSKHALVVEDFSISITGRRDAGSEAGDGSCLASARGLMSSHMTVAITRAAWR